MKHTIRMDVYKNDDGLYHAKSRDLPGVDIAHQSFDKLLGGIEANLVKFYAHYGLPVELTIDRYHSVNVEVTLLPATTIRSGDVIWAPEVGTDTRIVNVGGSGLLVGDRKILSEKNGAFIVDGVGAFTLRRNGMWVKDDCPDDGPCLAYPGHPLFLERAS